MKKLAILSGALAGLLGGIVSSAVIAGATRNTSGTYTLPPSAPNPVVTGTTITSSWANTTLSDIGTEITGSLSRSGKGAMLAPLRLTNGTVLLPSLTFDSDTDTGLYRIGANNPAISANGTKVQEWSGTAATFPLLALHSDGLVSAPSISFTNDVDTGIYRIGANNPAMSAGNTKVQEWSSTTTTVPKGLVATQSTSNGAGITATGNGSGEGLLGTGGSSGNGVTANGTGTGRGIVAIGGSTNSLGVYGIGGSTNGTGILGQGSGSGNGVAGIGGTTNATGVVGTGGATNGVGIAGTGTGSGTGVTGAGGATNGIGVSGAGAGSGAGGYFVGDTTGNGIEAFGGSTNGTIGVVGTVLGSNGTGVKGTGIGTGNGGYFIGGASAGGNGIKCQATGGASNTAAIILVPQTAPSTPVNGQIWLQSSDNKVHIYSTGSGDIAI